MGGVCTQGGCRGDAGGMQGGCRGDAVFRGDFVHRGDAGGMQGGMQGGCNIFTRCGCFLRFLS